MACLSPFFRGFFQFGTIMDKKRILALSARLLLFIIPVIVGSLLISGILTGLYAERGVTKAMSRLMIYKAEDLIRHASSQWNLLLENELNEDLAYRESLRRSIRSYAITMLREDGEWILAVDEDFNVVFSVGASADDDSIQVSLEENLPAESGVIWIDGPFGGEHRVGYGFVLPSLGWTVYITDLRISYFGDLSFVRSNYIFMMLFTTIVSSLFIIFYVRRSMRPLKTVIKDMHGIVIKRDFQKRVIPIQNDEVGELAREFNLMSDYLDRAMNRLKDIAHSEAEARIEIRNRERETLDVLSRVSILRDLETARHTSRVGMYASLLSELQEDSQDEVDLMRWAVPLHDIGKLGISDTILLKKDSLDVVERSVMESHVFIGHEILKNSESAILKAGADIVLSHHERWDGSGYPNGLKGTDIPVRGRITGLVDVFDALLTERSYKKAWSLEQTIEWIVERKGADFDPELVDLFIGAVDRVQLILDEYGDDSAEDILGAALK